METETAPSQLETTPEVTEKKKRGRARLPDDVRLARKRESVRKWVASLDAESLARRRENSRKWMEANRAKHNANVMRKAYVKKYGDAKAVQLMALHTLRTALKPQ